MRERTLADHISSTLQAIANCEQSGNTEWRDTWRAVLRQLARDYLPRGSGFDSGSTINEDRSRPDCLVLGTEFHHMDENGCYDGWTQHTIRVRPTFGPDFSLAIGGRDRNGIKDYIAETFELALSAKMPDAEWCAIVARHRPSAEG